MLQELLQLHLIFAVAVAAPTTTPPATAHFSTASTPSTSEVIASTNTTVPENSTATGSTTLLHWRHDFPSAAHRVRGRIILANTRAEGSEDWGLTAEEAEIACDRIARYQSEFAPHNLLSAIVRRLLPRRRTLKVPPMEGHLLSVGSGQEVLTLSHLLSPLPSGAYWTGGKLVRYRVNSMKRNTFKDHIVLTWSDGRVGQPSVLGMTREDEEKLREGYNYCLALNLADAAWQARDCADLLPYACVITPRQVGFSNEAEGKVTPSFTSTASTLSTETNSAEETTTEPSTEATTTTTVPPQETTTTTGIQKAPNTEKVTSIATKFRTAAAQNGTSTVALLAAVQSNSNMTSTTSSGGATESSSTLSGSKLLQEGVIAAGITVTPEENGTTTVVTISTKNESQVSGRKQVAEISVRSGSTTNSSEPTEPMLKVAGGLLQETAVATETGSPQAGFTTPVTVVGSTETSESISAPAAAESVAVEPVEQQQSSEGI
ncbi:unnamed protein product [Dicrocoelium dendriticum]|nr:unnamed protein product [Dicrocoelium dendriticum]